MSTLRRSARQIRPRSRLRPALDRLEGRALMAVAGTLDPTFGGGQGYVLGPISAGTTTPNILEVGGARGAVEPDGSVVVATSDAMSTSVTISDITTDLTLAVRRVEADGTPDTTFGTGGKTDVPLPTGFAITGGPSNILIGPSGQILVIGFQDLENSAGTTENLLAMFNADGSLDTSFGTGGVLATSTSIGYTAAFEPDGDVVINANGGLMLLTPQGTFDTSFGTDGLAAFPPASGLSGQYIGGLAVQANGQIAALIVDATPGANTDLLVRFNADGSADTSVSQAGIQAAGIDGSTDNGVGLAVEPDGQYLVLGSHQVNDLETAPILALLNSDGTLAKSVALFSVASATFPSDLTLQPNGDVVMMAGSVYTPANATAVVYRLTPELTPDPTFGDDGLSTIDLPPATVTSGNFYTSSLLVSSNNQVMLVGNNAPVGTDGSSSYYYVARLKATPTPATPGDFTGDGISDPAVYLTGTGTFVIGNSSGGAGQVVQLGTPGVGNSIPAPADYYGTGQDDLAVYLANIGVYAIKDPSGQTPGLELPIGIPGVGQTIPAPGDYYGTGSDQVAVYLARSATWDILAPGLKTGLIFPFGQPGIGNSIPVPGDYLGTGQDEVAVYLPQDATFAMLTPGLKQVITFGFGIAGAGNSIPVPGDYDGSGHTEMAVYLPSLGEVKYLSGSGLIATIPFGIKGAGQTLLEPGDYDGSGVTEVAAYLPSVDSFVYRPADARPNEPDVSFTVGFAGSGPIVPVTAVVPSSLLPSGPGETNAIEPTGAMGEADDLDFLMPLITDAKKAKPGDTTTH